MAKYPLQRIEKNEILKYFLQKPSFLSSKDEKILIDFVKSDKLRDFYNYASKLIKNTRDVANLYIYLIDKLESRNLSNEEIKNHVCWRLFNISSVGWLSIHDPEIIEYCKKNTTDKVLLKEIKEIKSIKWFKQYLEIVHLEKQISNNFEQMEKNIENYYDFISKLLKTKKIKQEKYDEVIGYLQEETSIYKGKQIIGSLISEKLQEKLGFRMIVPKLSISKSDSKLLLRQEE